MNAHFLNTEWERVMFCLSCVPFDESHTGVNIYKKLNEVLNDWKIRDKISLCLRDNAANMEAAFNPAHHPDLEPNSILEAVGCLNHSLQLVIKDFFLVSVDNLITACRRLASYANQSTKFYTVFYEEQRKCGITNQPSLKQDVATR